MEWETWIEFYLVFGKTKIGDLVSFLLQKRTAMGWRLTVGRGMAAGTSRHDGLLLLLLLSDDAGGHAAVRLGLFAASSRRAHGRTGVPAAAAAIVTHVGGRQLWRMQSMLHGGA